MSRSTKKSLSGAAMAMAAAGFVSGCAMADEGNHPSADPATVELGHCYGVNVCKGHNDCAAGANQCAGQGSCKGTGFVGMPVDACEDVGGEVRDEWRGEVAASELIHCLGVNICKGHNDCKTAANGCAGQASCEGTGFVAMHAKACEDIGGEVES